MTSRALRLASIGRQAVWRAARGDISTGLCPICERRTVYLAFPGVRRDSRRCVRCRAVDRWRALWLALEEEEPGWRNLQIYEPSSHGPASARLQREARHLTVSDYWPDRPRGAPVGDVRCEDLTQLTFPDEAFDVVITQDVLEHVASPERAFSEIARVLRPGGVHLFTVPVDTKGPTQTRAVLSDDGELVHLLPPTYHLDPIDPSGALVFTDFGCDLSSFIDRQGPTSTEAVELPNGQRAVQQKEPLVWKTRRIP